MNKNSHIATSPKPSRLVDSLDARLRRDGKGGLSPKAREIAEDTVYATKRGILYAGAIASAAAVTVAGFAPRELGSSTTEVQEGNLSTIVENGVAATGVEGVDQSDKNAAAQTLDRYAPGYFQPGDTAKTDITQTGFQFLLGQKTVTVTNPRVDGPHG